MLCVHGPCTTLRELRRADGSGQARHGPGIASVGIPVVSALRGEGGSMNLWGIVWRSNDRIDGRLEYLMCCGTPYLFQSRKEARELIEREWGYIRNRPDLRSEPHGWKMPKAVKVQVVRV